MKKTIMSILGIMMVLSLAACTPTTEKNKTGEVKQTQAAGKAADKTPDPTAPDLDIISVYAVENGELVSRMDAVEDMTPQLLADLLIENGMLEEGTQVLSFESVGKVEEVGPGIVEIPGIEIDNSIGETGILDLNQAISDDENVIQAIADTFIENMNVTNLTIQVNGETVKEGITYVDPVKQTSSLE